MFPYREVLARLRAGDTDREVARSGLMGRQKVASFRAVAAGQGWLAPDRALPDESEIGQVLGQSRRARSTVSSVEPWRALVAGWLDQGVQGTTIHGALCRDHGYTRAATPRWRAWSAAFAAPGRSRQPCGCTSNPVMRRRSTSAPGRCCATRRVSSSAPRHS